MNDISEFASEEEWIKAAEEAKNQVGIVAAGISEQDEIINWHELYEVVRLAYNDQLKEIEVLRNKLKASEAAPVNDTVGGKDDFMKFLERNQNDCIRARDEWNEGTAQWHKHQAVNEEYTVIIKRYKLVEPSPQGKYTLTQVNELMDIAAEAVQASTQAESQILNEIKKHLHTLEGYKNEYFNEASKCDGNAPFFRGKHDAYQWAEKSLRSILEWHGILTPAKP